MISPEIGPAATQSSRLLDLPTELRLQIFANLFQNLSCARTYIIWDLVYTAVSDHPTSDNLAPLLTCRQLYSDCFALPYDCNRVSVCVRSDDLDPSFSRFQHCLGATEECVELRRLQHVDLEIDLEDTNEKTVQLVVARLARLKQAFMSDPLLRTLRITLLHLRERGQITKDASTDAILEACMNLGVERLLSVHRNEYVRNVVSAETWQRLQDSVTSTTSTSSDGMAQRLRDWEYWWHHENWRKNL